MPMTQRATLEKIVRQLAYKRLFTKTDDPNVDRRYTQVVETLAKKRKQSKSTIRAWARRQARANAKA